MNLKNLILFSFLLLFPWYSLHAQTATLIKDIETTEERPSLFRSIAEVNGKIILSLNDGIHGEELFVMNTVSSNPQLLVDINPGVGNSNPHGFSLINGKIIFIAESNSTTDLWITDGTSGGTRKIAVNPSNHEFPRAITPAGNKLFFKETLGLHEEGLYVTDGTDEGTHLLKTLYFDGGYQFPDQLFVYNSKVYFKDGFETWVSNGTSEGTTILSSPLPLPMSGVSYYEFNHAVYFSTFGSAIETWHWDGTVDGTYKLANGKFGSITSGITFNGKFYFTSSDSQGESMWSIDSQNTISLITRAYSIKILSAGSYLLLNIVSYAGGDQSLWRSDGTTQGTGYLTTFSHNNLSYIPIYATAFSNNKSLVVGRNLGTGGDKIWQTDGTTLGTTLFDQFKTTTHSAFAEKPVLLLGKYFIWQSYPGNYKLYYFDGTPNGIFTVPLPQLNSSSSPTSFFKYHDQVLFSAYSDFSYGLWSTQGGSQNTFLLKKPVSGSGSFSDPLEWNDQLYFSWAQNNSDIELWKTDGTTNGTVLVKDIVSGNSGSSPKKKFLYNNKLYFFVVNNNKQELWNTDGTTSGTQYAMDLNEPYLDVFVNGPYFYFIGIQQPLYKPALYKSDGTPEGTLLIKSFESAGIPNYYITSRSFFSFQNNIYFLADDGSTGMEIWKMNLSDESVTLVKDINPGSASSNPQLGYLKNDHLYFAANDGTSGNEFWISDGTETNTFMLNDIVPGANGIQLSSLVEYNNKVYLSCYDNNLINSIWMTDGTPGGTTVFYQQTNISEEVPYNLYATHGKLFFAQGGVLKQSMGTSATIQSVDLGVNFDKQYTGFQFFEFNDLALFQGYTPDIGSELWALDFRTQSQTIDFSVTDKTYGDPDFEIAATSSAGLPVILTSSHVNRLNITNHTGHITGTGAVTIKASQSGTSLLKNAYKESTILIAKAHQSITFDLPSPVSYSPSGHVSLIASSTSGLPVRFESSVPNLFAVEGAGELLKEQAIWWSQQFRKMKIMSLLLNQNS